MSTTHGQGGHSAEVRMRLLVDGQSLPIAQMGPDFIILKEAAEHPPTDAMLELCIDASERRWKVRLPHGISSDSLTVAIAKVI